jgi:hypothetical protein
LSTTAFVVVRIVEDDQQNDRTTPVACAHTREAADDLARRAGEERDAALAKAGRFPLWHSRPGEPEVPFTERSRIWNETMLGTLVIDRKWSLDELAMITEATYAVVEVPLID